MLGMVFTELIEMVEARFSADVADRMIEAVEDEGGSGAYTAVGHYPAEQVGRMVGKLSELTGIAPQELVRAFGRHLLDRFAQGHPAHFARHPRVFDFLAAIDQEIHVEVRRLYPAATLPRFDVLHRDERSMRLAYSSPRRMEALALGLIERLGEHCGEPVTVAVEPTADGCIFTIERQAA